MTALHPIPTEYRNTRFRSRLEARWAAVFDLLGWRWSYEPVDLAGYIPDFLVRGRNSSAPDLLVEVTGALEYGDLAERAEDVRRWTRTDALVVGTEISWWVARRDGERYPNGLLSTRDTYGVDDAPELCQGFIARARCGNWSVDCLAYGWGARVACCATEARHDNKHCRDGDDAAGDEAQLERIWAQAGNMTQWRPR